MRRALIDTGAIYALVARTDQNHAAAVGFLKSWLAQGGLFVLADVVFAETMTLAKRRLGTAVALRVGRELRQNPVYVWTVVSPQLEPETWVLFQKYDDKDWSYTDCTLLALAEHLKIREVFAFDEDFDQMPGMARYP